MMEKKSMWEGDVNNVNIDMHVFSALLAGGSRGGNLCLHLCSLWCACKCA